MRKHLFLTLVAALLACTPALAQQGPLRKLDAEQLRGAAVSAGQALAAFGAVVDERNYRTLGFDEPGDVRRATLGVPIRVFMVRLDELRNYAPGRDPADLLHDTQRMHFPVLVDGRTRSSVTVARTGNAWTTAGFGGANYARTADTLRGEIARRDAGDPSDYFEVAVPALNAYFIGVARGGVLQLTPLLSYPAMNLERGSTLPARDALNRMVPAARAHSGLPS